jgi:translation elongation factor EF-Tu-like GTPase
MTRPFIATLAVAAAVTLAAAGSADAAKKKSIGHAQMDGAILVVSAADGPMPAKPSGNWGYLRSRNGMTIILMSRGVHIPTLRVGR